MDFSEKTRTQGTIEHYESIYRTLQRRVARDERMASFESVTPAQIALLYEANEGKWQAATSRGYRAAILHVFDRLELSGDPTVDDSRKLVTHQLYDEETLLHRQEKLRLERRNLKKKTPQTASQKVKRLSKEDAMRLVTALMTMRSHWGPIAAQWFVAGSLTGLRPCEWQDAKFDVDIQMRRVLVVKNAKNTNSRSHGETRTIVLSGLSAGQMNAIDSHLNNVRVYAAQNLYDQMYTNCRQCIHRTAEKLWPYRLKHPSLYTARHMFSADVKTIFDKVGVAALMGHASIDTAGSHYAPARSGRGGLGVEPGEDDVQMVRLLNSARIETGAEDGRSMASNRGPASSDPNWPASAINQGANRSQS